MSHHFLIFLGATFWQILLTLVLSLRRLEVPNRIDSITQWFKTIPNKRRERKQKRERFVSIQAKVKKTNISI